MRRKQEDVNRSKHGHKHPNKFTKKYTKVVLRRRLELNPFPSIYQRQLHLSRFVNDPNNPFNTVS